MGKIVKFCVSCEESFAEKFSFCPNCASGLTAYEMNPLVVEAKPTETVKIFEPADEVPFEIIEEPTAPFETAVFETEPQTPIFLSRNTDDVLELEDEEVFEAPLTVAPPTAASIAPSTFEDYQQTYQTYSDDSYSAKTEPFLYEPQAKQQKADDDGFYNVTFVEEKNSGVRNSLLLGATLLVFSVAFGYFIYDLFNSNAYVAALDDRFNDVIFVEEPMATEPDPPEPKNKDKDDGGGGGGGKEQQVETSKGRLATQVEKPMISPSVTMDQVTRPELVLEPATQGKKTAPPSTEKYGNPNSTNFNISSDGTGSGGGQGSGQGTGQGSGRGTGQGSGIGSGSGNGNGDGDGDGSGRGSGDRDRDRDRDREREAPPPIKVGPTVALNITSKPRANYTDPARTNQVQGTVTLRVTFLANGQIGGISPINGLPYGLTEQAIAAARSIRFEPAKKNGVPYAVTKQVQYNFTLY